MAKLIIYLLKCGHKVTGPATLVSGILHCPWHHGGSPIADVEAMEWQAKCHSCRYARWAGMSESVAEMFANSHARHNPRHQVRVQRRANPEAVRTKDKLDAWQVRS